MMDFPIIDKLGGASAAHKKLKAAGYEISLAGISMWKKRGIPGPAVVCLMRIAEKEGFEVASGDFVLQGAPEPEGVGIKRVIATR